jgi:hypothetical protein
MTHDDFIYLLGLIHGLEIGFGCWVLSRATKDARTQKARNK